MVSAGMMCVKYLLFCFNLLFTLAGICVVTLGVVVHLIYTNYSSFVYPSLQVVPIVLIAVGITIFIIAFLGCCGAAKENQCMITTFAFLLIVIFVLEITAGIVGYIHRNEVEVMLDDKLNSTISEYYTNEKIRRTWDIAQHEAECCGVHGPTDWQRVTKNNSLPHTCCPDTADDGSCTLRSEHYTASCLDKLKAVFSTNITTVESFVLTISFLQIFGIVLACTLRRAIRHEYETV